MVNTMTVKITTNFEKQKISENRIQYAVIYFVETAEVLGEKVTKTKSYHVWANSIDYSKRNFGHTHTLRDMENLYPDQFYKLQKVFKTNDQEKLFSKLEYQHEFLRDLDKLYRHIRYYFEESFHEESKFFKEEWTKEEIEYWNEEWTEKTERIKEYYTNYSPIINLLINQEFVKLKKGISNLFELNNEMLLPEGKTELLKVVEKLKKLYQAWLRYNFIRCYFNMENRKHYKLFPNQLIVDYLSQMIQEKVCVKDIYAILDQREKENTILFILTDKKMIMFHIGSFGFLSGEYHVEQIFPLHNYFVFPFLDPSFPNEKYGIFQ